MDDMITVPMFWTSVNNTEHSDNPPGGADVPDIITADPTHTTVTHGNSITTDPIHTTATEANMDTADPMHTTVTEDTSTTTDLTYTTATGMDIATTKTTQVTFMNEVVKVEVVDNPHDLRLDDPVVNIITTDQTVPTPSAVTSDSGETVEELWDLFTRWCHSVGVQAPASVSEMRESISVKTEPSVLSYQLTITEARTESSPVAELVTVKQELPGNDACAVKPDDSSRTGVLHATTELWNLIDLWCTTLDLQTPNFKQQMQQRNLKSNLETGPEFHSDTTHVNTNTDSSLKLPVGDATHQANNLSDVTENMDTVQTEVALQDGKRKNNGPIIKRKKRKKRSRFYKPPIKYRAVEVAPVVSSCEEEIPDPPKIKLCSCHPDNLPNMDPYYRRFMYYCHLCPYYFYQPEALETHVAEHHKDGQNISLPPWSKDYIQEPSSVNIQVPSSVNLQEPSSVNIQEPSSVNIQEPSSVNLQEPSSVNIQEPSNVNLHNSSISTCFGFDFPSDSSTDSESSVCFSNPWDKDLGSGNESCCSTASESSCSSLGHWDESFTCPSPEKNGPTSSSPQKESHTDPSPEKNGPTSSSPQKESLTGLSPQEENPTCVSPQEENPTCVSPQEENPTCVSPQEENPTCVSPQEENPTCVSPQEENPTCVSPQEENPTCVSPQEENPTCVSPGKESPTDLSLEKENATFPSLEKEIPTGLSPEEETPTYLNIGSEITFPNLIHYCDFCPYFFTKPEALETHVEQHHSDGRNVCHRPWSDVGHTEEYQVPRSPGYESPFWYCMFSRYHKPPPPETFPDADPWEMLEFEPSQLRCCYCNKQFSLFWELEYHRGYSNCDEDRRDLPSICHICGSGNAGTWHLEMHNPFDKKTGETKSFFCKPCKFYYENKHRFKDHYLAVHAIIEPKPHPLKCPQCPFIPRTTKKKGRKPYFGGMAAHNKIHEPVDPWRGRKEFSCDECPSYFCTNSSLEGHKRRLHKPEAERKGHAKVTGQYKYSFV